MAITVFTDGASRGNPGPGGWGTVIILSDKRVIELSGREENTTNNRMELSAARAALEYIEKQKMEGGIEIHTDSAYLLQGVTQWMYGWQKNGWKTSTGEDVLNQDLWKDILDRTFRMKLRHSISWHKVKGHAGLRGNERADVLATKAADKDRELVFTGDLASYEKFLGGSVFDTMTEGALPVKKPAKKGEVAYSYVSMVGGLVATHKTWKECEARVRGKSGAKFKKAFSKAEEESLMQQWTEKHFTRPR